MALKDNLFEKEETVTQLAYVPPMAYVSPMTDVSPMALPQMVNDSYSDRRYFNSNSDGSWLYRMHWNWRITANTLNTSTSFHESYGVENILWWTDKTNLTQNKRFRHNHLKTLQDSSRILKRYRLDIKYSHEIWLLSVTLVQMLWSGHDLWGSDRQADNLNKTQYDSTFKF